MPDEKEHHTAVQQRDDVVEVRKSFDDFHGNVFSAKVQNIPTQIRTLCRNDRVYFTLSARFSNLCGYVLHFRPCTVIRAAVWAPGKAPLLRSLLVRVREHRRASREVADPIGGVLLITAGERSHPQTGIHIPFRPHGGRTSLRRRACVGYAAMSIWRAAAPRFRGCACGLHAVIEVGPLWGSHVYIVLFRRFAFGSPAVIDVRPLWGRLPRGVVSVSHVYTTVWDIACVARPGWPTRGYGCRGRALPRTGETR